MSIGVLFALILVGFYTFVILLAVALCYYVDSYWNKNDYKSFKNNRKRVKKYSRDYLNI